MRVNEILARVDDKEVVCLHLGGTGIIDYKKGIMKDSRYKGKHVGEWLVTDICVQEMNKVLVLAITACEP